MIHLTLERLDDVVSSVSDERTPSCASCQGHPLVHAEQPDFGRSLRSAVQEGFVFSLSQRWEGVDAGVLGGC